MSFLIKDDEVWEKYEKNWDVIKNKLSIKFHSKPIFEQKFLKAKVIEFDGVIKTNFLGNDILKENMHYTCIARIAINSVMRIDKKKTHLQVYLEERKYRVKKLDSEKEESKFDAELMASCFADFQPVKKIVILSP